MGNIHIRNKLKGITPCKTLTYEEVCSRIEIIRLNQSLAQTLINQLLTIGRIARRRNGLGMVVAVDPADVEKAMEAMKAAGDTPYVVGKITDGEKGVTLC